MSDHLEPQSGAAMPSREQQFEKLLNAYSGYYDVVRDFSTGGMVFPAVAEFHSRSEKYVLVKAAKIWGMEMNEYVYFLLAGTLSPDDLTHAIDVARENGMSRIHPHNEHMYSHISLVIVADEISPEAARLLRRFRLHKDFRLALHGWMEFRIAAFDRSEGKIVSNPAGRDVRETLERNLIQR